MQSILRVPFKRTTAEDMHGGDDLHTDYLWRHTRTGDENWVAGPCRGNDFLGVLSEFLNFASRDSVARSKYKCK